MSRSIVWRASSAAVVVVGSTVGGGEVVAGGEVVVGATVVVATFVVGVAASVSEEHAVDASRRPAAVAAIAACAKRCRADGRVVVEWFMPKW